MRATSRGGEEMQPNRKELKGVKELRDLEKNCRTCGRYVTRRGKE